MAATQAGRAGPSVAVIGGGIAGLMTAVKLRQLGIHSVVVFDTGKNAVGGRASTRTLMVDVPGGQRTRMLVDHSAQLLSATQPRFQKMLDHWESLGVVKKSNPATVGSLGKSGFTPMASDAPPVYHAPQGIQALAAHLADGLSVQRPVWVGRVQQGRQPGQPGPYQGLLWDVHGERDKLLGSFNYLVVAHNGKCADRLMGNAGVPAIHSLLRTKFTPTPTSQQMMQLCSLWVYIAVFPSSLGLKFHASSVDDPDISWVANNTARMEHGLSQQGSLEAWTIISTRAFGSANKVSQENVPPAKDKEVKAALLSAFARAVSIPLEQLRPVHQRAQLWGAAVPLNVGSSPAVIDADSQCGIAGDWLVAPSIEGAALSGVAMAELIAAHAAGTAKASVGLDCKFQVVATPAIGAVSTGPLAPAQQSQQQPQQPSPRPVSARPPHLKAPPRLQSSRPVSAAKPGGWGALPTTQQPHLATNTDSAGMTGPPPEPTAPGNQRTRPVWQALPKGTRS